MKTPRALSLSVLTTLLANAALAQEWYLEHQNGPPLARRFHTIAHVAGNEVLFGGVDEQSGTVHGDTWRYDGLGWTALPAGGPGARQRFAACVDTNRDVLVVFGGLDANGQTLGDTWEFDGSGWLPRVLLGAPAARMGASMAFDTVRNRVVMFGGGATATAPTNETWEYDGNAWTQIAPATAPSARQGHAMTFDTASNVVMLFGGSAQGASGFANDTWQWNGTSWQQLVTSSTPPGFAFPALTFFEPHGVAVLAGGSGAATQPLATWIFDGLDWSVGPASPAGFTSRQGHAITYDRAREMIVLFGGARIAIGGAIPSADTWELSIRAAFDAFGTGCAFAAGTPVLSASNGARPQLGSLFQLEVAPAGSLALFVAGTSATSFLGTPLPIDLSPLGLPGCELLTSVDVAQFAPVTGSVATFTLPVPVQRTLLGAELFVQALATRPGAAIPGAMSNAGRVTIGN